MPIITSIYQVVVEEILVLLEVQFHPVTDTGVIAKNMARQVTTITLLPEMSIRNFFSIYADKNLIFFETEWISINMDFMFAAVVIETVFEGRWLTEIEIAKNIN